MALSSMGRYEDAIVSAEEGYKLRQSDTVCKECVSQWLVANQSIHKGLVQRYQSLIPPGCLILSEKIGALTGWVILVAYFPTFALPSPSGENVPGSPCALWWEPGTKLLHTYTNRHEHTLHLYPLCHLHDMNRDKTT